MQNNSSTLISVNKGKPFDTLEEPVKMTFLHFEDRYGMPELYFELCPRYGPLAHEPTVAHELVVFTPHLLAPHMMAPRSRRSAASSV